MQTESILPPITGTQVLRDMARAEWNSDKIRGLVKKVSDAEVFLTRALYHKAGWSKEKIVEVLDLGSRVGNNWVTQVVNNSTRRNVRYHPRMRHPAIFHELTNGEFK